MGKLDKINDIIADQKRKTLFQILKESIHAGFIEKEIPLFYFYNLLYKEDSADYRNFVGMKKRNNILNNFYTEHQSAFIDKIKFNELLTSHNIPTPRILAHSRNHEMNYDSKKYTLNDEKQLENLLKELTNRSDTQSIFVKPLDGAGGSDAFKFDNDHFDTEKVDKLFKAMENINFIFQETIIQDQRLSEIYPNSINTLRIYTFFDRDTQEVEIILALLRIGSKGSVVDNESMFISVDTKDQWVLKGVAKSFLHNGGKSFEKHPDNNFLFDGFVIPFQDEIANVLKKAAPLLPKDYIGWDVALSEDGPTIIEANDRPHIIMTQIMRGGFKGHPQYRKILKNYI